MDPNQTLLDLVQAIREDNWAEAVEHARNLQLWKERGGFFPLGKDKILRSSLVESLIASVLVLESLPRLTEVENIEQLFDEDVGATS